MPLRKHILNTAKVGEVWGIILETDCFGYFRIFQGGCLGVIPIVSQGLVEDVRQFRSHPERWFFGFAAPPSDQTQVFRVGTLPFPNPSAGWPPPRFAPPDIFHSYFRIWDRGNQRRAEEAETRGLQKAQTLSPDELRGFIIEHRRDCDQLEGDLRAGTSASGPRPSAAGKQKPILLEIVFRTADFPFASRDLVEDPLAQALETAKVGEVTGGGSGRETSAIDVEVGQLAEGLKVIRETLRKLGCPANTEIHQYEPHHTIHRL